MGYSKYFTNASMFALSLSPLKNKEMLQPNKSLLVHQHSSCTRQDLKTLEYYKYRSIYLVVMGLINIV